jgi:bifunctional non-homologous end joining protein LigD
MGVLELHPWGSRVESLEKPDRMTIDLDPAPDVPWTRMIETALALRGRMKGLGLESFVKTTGGKGLHVVVPLQARQTWDELKEFSRAIVEEFVRASPAWFVATMTKSKRTGKIFLDFFRNTRGATAVAAYSTRARPGAPVSTPLTWEELPGVKSGDAFTLATVPDRLERLSADPWKGFFEVRQSITAAMRRAVGLKS